MTDAPDAFAAVADLLAIISDAKICSARLADLRRLEAAIVKERAKFDSDRAALAADREAIATAKAELDACASKLAQREIAARGLETTLRERAQTLAASRPERFPLDGNLGPGSRSHSGLTREPDHG